MRFSILLGLFWSDFGPYLVSVLDYFGLLGYTSSTAGMMSDINLLNALSTAVGGENQNITASLDLVKVRMRIIASDALSR